MSQNAIVTTDLPLKLIAKGKVRDVYDAGLVHGPHAGAILFVATDRISAFDIILNNGIPNKGKLLHALSTFWFDLLTPSVIESHIIATDYEFFPFELKAKLESVKDQVQGRSMLVKRAKVLPIEAIVRGYITGSGWAEYKRTGTVHGIQLAADLEESQQIPNGPLFTPSTKAEQGDHDENIHPDKVADIIGSDLAKRMSCAAVALYSKAAAHAKSRGIILADTKFEFGIVGENDTMILVDEVLTPDSSRFWSAETYKVGTSQDSFDKQYVRDWLKKNGLDKAADQGIPVTLPDDVVKRTEQKYREAYQLITGKNFDVTKS
ncbi:probable ADE1 -phosphoribosylamidoimidazole-succinocarboxamide synthase [Melanopsichium pennsylvanicum]|uniref:Phosphoribosylaminoimidazole-succinocarboxamide synthase n=2 Tax=Melanopsichium pennsylvanicum TaxID=63383 RepID=A0AAJ4XST0_9BASI|nr:probable ADE1-phosphoribosylamidoimidazole-succinocarboxamide synthase [Melanopsichium pennsylvanicum 4]SNX87708.1 probable ADE1 -phosphoribosylamidoimidazole-succinocarboxamide synthase [Melanopsichium pennsylvanicum]